MTDSADMFRRLAQQRKKMTEPGAAAPDATVPEPTPSPSTPKKRGRPATGKRSDPSWIGRTYYIRRNTDFDVAGALLELKRQGIEIDRSELVDRLLSAWAKSRQDGDSDFRIGEILQESAD